MYSFRRCHGENRSDRRSYPTPSVPKGTLHLHHCTGRKPNPLLLTRCPTSATPPYPKLHLRVPKKHFSTYPPISTLSPCAASYPNSYPPSYLLPDTHGFLMWDVEGCGLHRRGYRWCTHFWGHRTKVVRHIVMYGLQEFEYFYSSFVWFAFGGDSVEDEAGGYLTVYEAWEVCTRENCWYEL